MNFWFEIFFLALLGLAFVAIGITSVVVLVRLFRGQRPRQAAEALCQKLLPTPRQVGCIAAVKRPLRPDHLKHGRGPHRSDGGSGSRGVSGANGVVDRIFGRTTVRRGRWGSDG